MDSDIEAFDQAIAQALREKLAGKNISRAELARRTGVHPNVIDRNFNGKVGIPASRLIIFANAMGVEAWQIIQAAQNILTTAEQEMRVDSGNDNQAQ